MNIGTIWQYLKETISDFIEDNAMSRAAAIAYFTILSLGPVLVICIAIAGLAFGQEAAQGAMVGQLRGLMGDQAAEAVQTMIASAGKRSSGVWATVIGFATLLLTASGVFGEMQSALNYVWKAQPKGGMTAILRARAASLGLVATLGFLLLVSLVVSAALSALGDYLNAIFPGIKVILQIVNIVISFVIVSALFAAVYKILPDRDLSWKDVIVGAVVTALLFTVGKTLIALYIGSTAVASSYGAAGALVIVLVWIYYSSLIFLLGSEFTKVWAAHHGSAEAFAARTQTDQRQPTAVPSPVQKVIAQGAQHRGGIGLFDVAALGTLLLVALKGGPKRSGWL
ncbi:MAG TPA: YihY/virulence factor BrkB family protein [Acetobacteraceae bacterium]|nr:YihY/virulence factor BrkB family protein [Acetobacteraceae bacterium]